MARGRVIHFSLDVTVPAGTGEAEVENAINAALDEPPCDWEAWTVGAAVITGVDLTDDINDLAKALQGDEEATA